MSKSRQNSNVPNRLTVADRTALISKVGTREGEMIYQADIGLAYTWKGSGVVDNGGTQIEVGTGSGWVASYSGAVNVGWFELSTTTDESSTLQFILNNFKKIYFDDIYLAKSLTISADNLTITGSSMWDSGLKLSVTQNNLLEVTGNFCKFDNFLFHGNSLEVSTTLVQLEGDKATFDKCLFTDILATTKTNVQYGLTINAQGVLDFNVLNSRFSNIRNTWTNEGQGEVLSGGLYLYNGTAHTNNGSTGRISNCDFTDMYKIGATDVSLSDSDGLRFFNESAFGVLPMSINIDNCRFTRIQKSGIKASHVSGLTISNTTVKSEGYSFPMLAGIRLQPVDGVNMTGIVLQGAMELGFNFKGSNILLDDVLQLVDETTSEGVELSLIQVQETDDVSILESNIHISNIVASKVGSLFNGQIVSGGVKGTAPRFKNISISNVDVGFIGTGTNSNHIQVDYISKVSLSNINITDENGENNVAVSCVNTQSLSMSDCNIQSGLQALTNEGSSISSNFSVSNSKFEIRDTGVSNAGKRIFYVRNNNAGTQQVSNVSLLGLDVSIPSYSSLVNSDTFIVFASNAKISDINIELRAGSTTKPPSHFNLSIINGMLSNFTLKDLSGIATAQYSIKSGSSEKLIINGINIEGSGNRGIDTGGSNNVLIDNLLVGIGETKVNVGTGTNIVQGANVLNWA